MLKSLVERDRQVIWHPYTQMKLATDPLPITSGEGSYLVDENGNRYLDAISNWWVNLHGHGHTYLAGKVHEQAARLEQLIFAGFTHEPAVRLAERLLDILPDGMSKLFYSDNGSTAVEVALKMALQYWKNHGKPRTKILALSNAYHGDTFGAMSVSGRGLFTKAFEELLFDVEVVDLEQGESAITDQFACFIYEPMIQGAGGMNMLDAGKLNALIRSCKEKGVICIADEIMTGFGRTGNLFASEYIDTKPDIICLSKGLTGGMMALGATVCTQNIYDAFLSDNKASTFFHGHSYTANPIACAAGNASLDLLLTDECRKNIERITHRHREFALKIANRKNIRNVRHLGTIVAFEVETDGADGYLNNISSVIHKQALQKGVLVRPLGNTVYLMPPYCFDDEQLNVVYECLIRLVG